MPKIVNKLPTINSQNKTSRQAYPDQARARSIIEIFIKLISTCLFIGYVPILGGTFASIFSAFVYYFLLPENIYFYSIILLFFLILSIFISKHAEKIFNKKDDKRIVIDEFVCFWICTFLLPKKPTLIFYALFFYRIFDMSKPSYIKKLQNIKGGVGVVIDDFICAVVTNLLMRFILSL